MEYHPGGIDELMRGAGLEGTQLFDEVSPCKIRYTEVFVCVELM